MRHLGQAKDEEGVDKWLHCFARTCERSSTTQSLKLVRIRVAVCVGLQLEDVLCWPRTCAAYV